MDSLPINSVRVPGLYKFVKIKGTGTYRWGDAALGCNHDDLLVEGEEAEGAGTIGVYSHYFKVIAWWSSTLKVSCTEKQIEEIASLLDLSYQEDWL